MTGPLARLVPLARSRAWWGLVLGAALTAEGVALWMQHGLGEPPCVLCIELRLWVGAFVLLGALGLCLPRRRSLLLALHGLALPAALGMAWTAWLTWATEKRLVTSPCSPFLDLPPWFAVDRWFPAVFEPQVPCGRTPELLPGMSLADVLLPASLGAVLAIGACLAALVVVTRPSRPA